MFGTCPLSSERRCIHPGSSGILDVLSESYFEALGYKMCKTNQKGVTVDQTFNGGGGGAFAPCLDLTLYNLYSLVHLDSVTKCLILHEGHG